MPETDPAADPAPPLASPPVESAETRVASAAQSFSMRVVSPWVRDDFAAHLRSALGLAENDPTVVCDDTTAPDDKVQRGYIAASVTVDGAAYSASVGTP